MIDGPGAGPGTSKLGLATVTGLYGPEESQVYGASAVGSRHQSMRGEVDQLALNRPPRRPEDFSVNGSKIPRALAGGSERFGRAARGLYAWGLRAGGATALFLAGCDISRLRFLGRWRSLNSLDHYIQEATSAQAVARIPPEGLANIAALIKQLPLFEAPPARSWCEFFSRAAQFSGKLRWRAT